MKQREYSHSIECFFSFVFVFPFAVSNCTCKMIGDLALCQDHRSIYVISIKSHAESKVKNDSRMCKKQ